MSIGKRLRDSFVAGTLLVLPLLVTVFVFRVAFTWTLGFVDPVVGLLGLQELFADDRLVAQVATLGVMLVGVVVLGYAVGRPAGRRALGGVGRLVDFVPVVRTVYGGVRQVADSFSDRSQQYERVVYVQSPWEEVYSLGFVTGEAPEDMTDHAGEPVYNVYQPASPNPTNGRLVLVPESRMVEADLSVRHAVRLLLTTGVAATSEEMAAVSAREEVAIDLPDAGSVAGSGTELDDGPGNA